MDGFWPTFTRRKQNPPDLSGDSGNKQSVKMQTPEKVVLPVQDTPEDAFQILVTRAEKVKTGQKIAVIGKPPNHVAVHSSICGEVTATIPMLNTLGYHVNCVRIDADGRDLHAGNTLFKETDSSELSVFLRDMGIPLDYNSLKSASVLLINATEFEPSITSRYRLMMEEGEKIVGGLKILLKASCADKVVIAVEKNQVALKSCLFDISRKVFGLEVKEVDLPLPDTLDEVIRQKEVFDKNNKKGKLSFGATFILDPSLIAAVFDACEHGSPYIEQLLTVTGSGIKTYRNFWVKTGTPLSWIIQQAGGNMNNLGRVTLGGPMMGIPQFYQDVPLIKRARGVTAEVALVFEEGRRSRFYKKASCVRCGKCVDVCTAGIQPGLIAEYVEHKRIDDAEELGILSCLECGLCYYVCPSMIPIVELIKMGKIKVKGKDALLTSKTYKTLYC